jgi:hypothetical protein
MDEIEKVIVEFVIPVESEAVPAIARKRQPEPHLGKCQCGSDEFVLASEMLADTIKGIPASRMYECRACGEYQLAK